MDTQNVLTSKLSLNQYSIGLETLFRNVALTPLDRWEKYLDRWTHTTEIKK